jgi:hypothetical protein
LRSVSGPRAHNYARSISERYFDCGVGAFRIDDYNLISPTNRFQRRRNSFRVIKLTERGIN